jgi:hypothetical protein
VSPLWIKYNCREKFGSSCILTVTFITFNSQHTVRGTSHWSTCSALSVLYIFISILLVLYFAIYTLMSLSLSLSLSLYIYIYIYIHKFLDCVFFAQLNILQHADFSIISGHFKTKITFSTFFFPGKSTIHFCLLWMILLKYSASSMSYFTAPCRLTTIVIIDVLYSQNSVSTGVIL